MILIDIILSLLKFLLTIYMLCIVITGILNLIGTNPDNQIFSVLKALIDPPCMALKKKFPKLLVKNQYGDSYYDLSPIILIVIIGCILIIINKVMYYFII